MQTYVLVFTKIKAIQFFAKFSFWVTGSKICIQPQY